MNQKQRENEQFEQLPLASNAAAGMEHRAELIAEIQAAIAEGLLPESHTAHALAWRWLQLIKDAGEVHISPINDAMSAFKGWITVAIVHARLALFAQYLTSIELAELQQRQLAHAGDWQILFTEIRQQMLADATVTDPAVRVLARRWQSLFRDSYCGDNPELENKIRGVLHQEPKLMLATGLDFPLLAFIQSAILFLDRPQHESDNAGPKPSAQRVATLRAAHQLLDSPLVLHDPLALKILGSKDESALRANPAQYNDTMSKALRASLVVRSRLAEDELEKAFSQGVRQYVILGAGLDTYAYRSKLHAASASVSDSNTGRIFEVDLPETQQWKRACLRAVDIQIPDSLTYVPINFEQDTLARALDAAGFRRDQPAFFSWLGVTMYLEQEAIIGTLDYIASCAKGSAVVFDYLVEPSLLAPMERVVINLVASRIAERGEPWKTYFDPNVLAETLCAHEFSIAHNVSKEELHTRYLSNRQDGLSLGNSSRLMHATV